MTHSLWGTAQSSPERECVDARHGDSKPYQMGLQVSYSVYPEVPSQGALHRVTAAPGGGLALARRAKHKKRKVAAWTNMYVEIALTLPLFIRLKSGHSALGHGCPQSLGRLMRQSSDQVGMLKTGS